MKWVLAKKLKRATMRVRKQLEKTIDKAMFKERQSFELEKQLIVKKVTTGKQSRKVNQKTIQLVSKR